MGIVDAMLMLFFAVSRRTANRVVIANGWLSRVSHDIHHRGLSVAQITDGQPSDECLSRPQHDFHNGH